MLNTIHNRILSRLAVTWLILSVGIGGLVFYLESEKIDDFVLGLAVKESEGFTGENLQHLNARDLDEAFLQGKVNAFLQSHFIIVELYDRNKRKVAEGSDPGEEAVEEKLKKYVHKFPLDKGMSYEKFRIDGEWFLQVLLPLRDTQGELAGYFEGVYRVTSDTVKDIEDRVLRTLVLVIAATLVTTLIIYPVILYLNRGLIRFSRDLLRTNIELMEVLGSAIAKRDSDTNAHNYRVTIYAIRLAEALGLAAEEIRNLVAGAFLHDVGKIGISDNILLKNGKLTDEEFAVMRTHVALGVEIIARSEILKGARDVVEFHHEKYNGQGYLKGLKGEEIPLNARIFAVVDVFDALTSRRPYKEPFSFEQAMAILHKDSGSHFDPRIVETFTTLAEEVFRQVGSASDPEIEGYLSTIAEKYFFQDAFLLERITRQLSEPARAPAAG